MKQETQKLDYRNLCKLFDCVALLSVIVDSEPTYYAESEIGWYLKGHEICLNWDKKRLSYLETSVNPTKQRVSTKEYVSFMGAANYFDLTFEEGYVDYGEGSECNE